MKFLLITLISMWLPGAVFAQCSGIAKSHTQLQWSKSGNFVSPNRNWKLEVKPILTSEENESLVQLRSCRSSESRILFRLSRIADAYWSRDSKTLFIINEPVANVGTLLLFDTTSAQNISVPNKPIDEVVKERLSHELGEERHIEFYLPQFIAWTSKDLIVTVGGASTSGGAGPMNSYCYGFLIDSSTHQIRDVLTADKLKIKYGVKQCQVSP